LIEGSYFTIEEYNEDCLIVRRLCAEVLLYYRVVLVVIGIITTSLPILKTK